MDEKYEGLSLGEFLRKLRVDKGKTINDMQNETGISKSYLSKLENNTKDNPSLYTIGKLSEYFKISFLEFQNFSKCKTYPEDGMVRELGEILVNGEYLFANILPDIEFKLLFKNFITHIETISIKDISRAEEFKTLELLDEIKISLQRLIERQ